MKRTAGGIPGGGTTAVAFIRPFAVRVLAGAMLFVASIRVSTAVLPGEDPLAVKDAVGRGMHAFYGGDFDGAYDQLTDAIEAGSDDPRAFYFRGLAAIRLGRSGEAEADFSAGAERESIDGSTRRVSRSLERVQGCDRLTLERHRKRARLAGLQRDEAAAARRYSAIEDPAEDLLRRRRPEDVGPELLEPRRSRGVEEVPAPQAKGDDEPMEGDDPFAAPGKTPADGEEEMAEPEEAEGKMAEEDDEKMADRDEKDLFDAK